LAKCTRTWCCTYSLAPFDILFLFAYELPSHLEKWLILGLGHKNCMMCMEHLDVLTF
jgi:hypothetical protein